MTSGSKPEQSLAPCTQEVTRGDATPLTDSRADAGLKLTNRGRQNTEVCMYNSPAVDTVNINTHTNTAALIF